MKRPNVAPLSLLLNILEIRRFRTPNHDQPLKFITNGSTNRFVDWSPLDPRAD